MGKSKDISCQKFGRLTALYRLHNYYDKKHNTYWLCICDCGNLIEVRCYNLTSGNTKSCGCLNSEPSNTKHGKCYTRVYHIYNSIKQRCYYKKHNSYKNYGGRGIKMYDEWLDDFMAFYNWAYENGYDDNLTIDRIDVNGNYEPNNCRWVDMKQQAQNRRSNMNYTINGETRCLKEWCELLGLNYKIVWNRINRLNQPIEKALELNA